jgi:very-short-patch-repair endonuclease
VSSARAQASDDLFTPAEAPLPPGAKKRKRAKNADIEDDFAFQCKTRGLPTPAREWEFAKKAFGRRWRLDFAFLDFKLAVEIEGLVVTRALVGGQRIPITVRGKPAIAVVEGQERLVSMGRHAHADGFREDCRKYSAAAELGWTVIRFDPQMVKKREAIEHTMRCLIARGWKNPGILEA